MTFNAVTHHHVYSLFTELHCSPDVARLLTRLTTVEGHLAQGSPASTAIANLLLVAFDRVFDKNETRLGVRFTRVLDDSLISGDRLAVAAMVDVVIREIRRIRLRPHRDKIRIMTDGHKKQACPIATLAGARASRLGLRSPIGSNAS